MRFMTDHSLGGVKEMVLGNYIIQKVEYVHADKHITVDFSPTPG